MPGSGRIQVIQNHHPSLKAIKALAYAGYDLAEIRELLADLMILTPPPGDSQFRSRYTKFRMEASQLGRDFALTRRQIDSLGLDPMYTFAREKDRRNLSPKSLFVRETLSSAGYIPTRMAVDVLLFIQDREPKDIVSLLSNGSFAHGSAWTEEAVVFYRDFLWDASSMTPSDWKTYGALAPHGFRLSYVSEFTEAGKYSLLAAAGLPSGLPEEQIIQHLLDGMYVKLESSLNQNPINDREVGAQLKALEVLSRLQPGRNRGVQEPESEFEKRCADFLGSFSLEMDDDPSKRTTIALEDLKGTVNDNERIGQLPAIIEAERNGWAGFEEFMKGGPRPWYLAKLEDRECSSQSGQKD